MSEMQQLSYPTANLHQPLAAMPAVGTSKGAASRPTDGPAASQAGSQADGGSSTSKATMTAQQKGQRSSNILRLFRLALGSISLFPVTNERVLRPRVRKSTRLNSSHSCESSMPSSA